MAQEQSRAQAQHKQVKNKHFWTFRAAAGDNAAPEPDFIRRHCFRNVVGRRSDPPAVYRGIGRAGGGP